MKYVYALLVLIVVLQTLQVFKDGGNTKLVSILSSAGTGRLENPKGGSALLSCLEGQNSVRNPNLHGLHGTSTPPTSAAESNFVKGQRTERITTIIPVQNDPAGAKHRDMIPNTTLNREVEEETVQLQVQCQQAKHMRVLKEVHMTDDISGFHYTCSSARSSSSYVLCFRDLRVTAQDETPDSSNNRKSVGENERQNLLEGNYGFDSEVFSMEESDYLKQLAINFPDQSNQFLTAEGKRFKVRPLKIKIGILMASPSKEYQEARRDQKLISGFSFDVFNEAVRILPYKVIIRKIPFNGSSIDLLKVVALKNFDAAVGDILITAEGYRHVEFTQPYLDASLAMVVATTKTASSNPWLFVSPFTPGMWLSVAAMSVFTGFVLWLLERQSSNQNGDSCIQMGPFWLFSLITLYYGQRESPKNKLSHLVLAPWMCLMLVVTSTFTGSLLSIMTTNSQPETSITDVNMLRKTNAAVGCDGSSSVIQYLVNVLQFKQENIRTIASLDDHAKALSSGKIKVAFVLTPHAKVLVARRCRGLTISGPTYNLGSFGYAFQTGSGLARDVSRAILRLKESGKLQVMEEEMLPFSNCSANANVNQSLGPEPFIGLFIISGGASAIALLVTVIRPLRQQWNTLTNAPVGLMRRGFWAWLVTLLSQSQTRNGLEMVRRSSPSPPT